MIRDSAWPQPTTGVSGLVTLRRVALSDAGSITDGAFLPDGRMLLRSYGTLYLLPAPEQPVNGRLATLDSIELPAQRQGESLTTRDGGRISLIGSGGRDQPVLRLDLQALGLATAAGPGTGSAVLPDGSPAGAPGISANTVLVAAAGLVLLGSLAFGIVNLVSRRR